MSDKFVAMALAAVMTVTGCAGAVSADTANSAPGKPTNLKVEMLEQAYGLDTKNPALSWVVNDADTDEIQTEYRIIVSSRNTLTGDVYDTGWIKNNNNTFVHISELEEILEDNQLYYWQVQTKDKYGAESPLSDGNAFMTGIGGEWQSLDGIWATPNAGNAWTDYTVEQTLSVTAGGALAMLLRIGSDGQNGYMAQFRTNDNNVKFHRISGGAVNTTAFYTLSLGESGVTLPTDGSEFKVKVEAAQSSLNFYFDTAAGDNAEQYVSAGSVDISGEGNLLSGFIGYRTGRFEAGTVDDIKITAANSSLLYESDCSESDGRFAGLSVSGGRLQVGNSAFSVYLEESDSGKLAELGRFSFIRSPKLSDSGKAVDKVIISAASRGTGNDRGIIYDLFLNGECLGAGSARELKQAGQQAETTVQRRIYYNSYDATALWNKGGGNVISALGNSRDAARSVLIQVTAFYTDGTKEIIANSGRDCADWKTLDGTNAFGDDGSGIATGFVTLLHDNVNMNAYPSGWKEIDFDDSSWAAAQVTFRPADSADISDGGNVLYPFGSENALRVVTNEPNKRAYQNESGNVVVDLGKEIVGGLKVDIDIASAQEITVHMGEEMNADGTVRWQLTAVPDYEDYWTLISGVNSFETATMRNFRYVELIGLDSETAANIIESPNSVSGWAIQQSFDETDSHFKATDGSAQATLLNRLYELCKYTIKATNQDLFVDSQARERGAYEGDLLVNANTSYAVSDNYTLARHSNEWLIDNPTWPNDYRIFSVEMAYVDYMYTGNTDSIFEYYTALKKKLVQKVEYEDEATGLIRPGNSEAGNSALIDWPVSERDGYQSSYYDVVLNSEYVGIYLNMAAISEALGYDDDAEFYRAKSKKLKATLLKYAYDEENGCFYDSLDQSYAATQHSSTHATAYALTYGVFDSQEMADEMCEFVYDNCKDEFKGSVYATYFILRGLYVGNHGELAERLMTNPKVGTDVKTFASLLDDLKCTITPEAWGHKWKANMTLSHPWGASPACSIAQGMFGIMPTKAGFEEFSIKLQPGEIASAEIKAPTVKGTVSAAYSITGDGINVSVGVPVNTMATVYLPDMGNSAADKVKLDGKTVDAERDGRFLKVQVGSGSHTLALPAEDNDDILLGDLDKNGNINVSDVVALRQAIMNDSADEYQKKAGDLDENGTLNVADVVALRRMIMEE